jgi:cytochrome c-type biogenesis protein CcmF
MNLVSLGNLMIGLCVGFALFGAFSFYFGRRLASPTAAGLGRATIYANFVFMTVANLAMVYALLGNHFEVSYVAHVGARETPRWISAISLWSSLEGSILFWGWILSAYSAVCIYVYRETDPKFMSWVGISLHLIALFFFILLALPANPFLPMNPIPDNGPGPNPLLQNHWLMAIHPPCLYLGYIGFSVPFSFAIAALMESDVEGRWVSMTRRWTLFAWSFQSMAIILGGWWSYAVLGWGGYWAWDPVENASFMPWLTATAFLHSVMVQEKRRLLPVWNLTLAILTFLLTILGTFLTRSGVLDSVHSFTESHIGPYFLVFIALVLAVSLALLLWKGPAFRNKDRFENVFSLEVLFLFNNLLFLSFCFVVFLGTLYPLAVEALKGTRISIGQPYFNQMTVPIVAMMLLLLSVGLVTPWKKGNTNGLIKGIRLPALLALLPMVGAVLLGWKKPLVLFVVYFAFVALFVMLLEAIKVGQKRGLRLFKDNPRRYGGFISHTGALIIIVAVAISASYGQEKEVTLKRGETAAVGNYSLTLSHLIGAQQPQRFEIKAVVEVDRNNKEVGVMTPQMNFYPNSREPIGTPAIRSTVKEDLYLTLIHFERDGSAASLKVIVTPAVVWIWIGGVIVMAGGLLALIL